MKNLEQKAPYSGWWMFVDITIFVHSDWFFGWRRDAVTQQCEGFAVSEALAYQHVLHMYFLYEQISKQNIYIYINLCIKLHCNLYVDIDITYFLDDICTFEFSTHSCEHLQLCDAGMVFYVAVTVGHPNQHVETKEPPWEVVSLTTSIMFHDFSIPTFWETFDDSGRDTIE